jgi:hypothetical protein
MRSYQRKDAKKKGAEIRASLHGMQFLDLRSWLLRLSPKRNLVTLTCVTVAAALLMVATKPLTTYSKGAQVL